MESSSNTSYFSLLQWLLGGGFLASLLGYFWNKYFRVRPKIDVTLVSGGSTQSYGGPDQLKFVWRPRLVLHNDSVYKARKVKLIDSQNTSNWKFTSKIPVIIEPDKKEEWSFEINKTEHRNTLIDICGEAALREHRLAEVYLPIVIGKAELIFAYDNEKDHTFYSVIKIKEKNSHSTLHWIKPRLSNF